VYEDSMLIESGVGAAVMAAAAKSLRKKMKEEREEEGRKVEAEMNAMMEDMDKWGSPESEQVDATNDEYIALARTAYYYAENLDRRPPTREQYEKYLANARVKLAEDKKKWRDELNAMLKADGSPLASKKTETLYKMELEFQRNKAKNLLVAARTKAAAHHCQNGRDYEQIRQCRLKYTDKWFGLTQLE
jgi:hypothetical protein